MTRKRKDYRELKVSSFSGYGYKSAPMLRIQGLWLEELGFNIGDPILVKWFIWYRKVTFIDCYECDFGAY